MAKQPDRLNIEKSDRALYDNLSKEIFLGKTRKEQFLYAMAVGFKNHVRRSLDTTEGFFLEKDLHPQDSIIINAVAIYENNGLVDILQNKEYVYKIAEEYARAGIKLIYDKVNSGQPGSYFKKTEIELIDLIPS